MKIDIVLTACDLNDHYLKLYPLVYDVWKKKFGLDCYLILIADSIPPELTNNTTASHNLEQFVILFPPIPNIHSAFVAQVIRILYPCLFENDNVLITDIDIMPISGKYFVDSIKDIPDDKFISYTNRYMKTNMLAICYNVANSRTWREIFATTSLSTISTISDITNTIISWYNPEYTSIKNCAGWFTDQLKLYEYVMAWDGVIRGATEGRLCILDDSELSFKRLDKRHKQYIVSNMNVVLEDIKKGTYSDFHIIKPYSKFKNHIHRIKNSILAAHF